MPETPHGEMPQPEEKDKTKQAEQKKFEAVAEHIEEYRKVADDLSRALTEYKERDPGKRSSLHTDRHPVLGLDEIGYLEGRIRETGSLEAYIRVMESFKKTISSQTEDLMKKIDDIIKELEDIINIRKTDE